MRDNWKIVRFEKLGHTFGGLTNKSADDFGEGKPYIPYLNIFENAKIDPDYLEYVKIKPSERQNKVQFGDLFFTTSSETPHEVGMTSVLLNDLGEAYLNSFCFGFRLQNFEDLSPEFAAYLFRGNEVRKTISDLAQGSTRYNLSKSILFDKLYLNLPPLSQQRKIAKILSTCDRVIAKTEEAIAKHKAIKQGMMHDLFTRGIDLSTGKLRPKYQDAPELYKESELGMIPKDWEVKRLEEFGSIHYGKDYKSNPYGRDIPIYGTGGIMGYTSIPLNNGPAVLTGRKGSINNPLYVEGEFWNVDTIFCIKVNDQTNVKWFFSQLSNRDLTKLNEATGVPSVSSTALNRLLFAIPAKDEQDEIANRIEAVLIKLKREQASLFKTIQIKSGLMQDLLSGKVEVSVSKKEEIMNA